MPLHNLEVANRFTASDRSQRSPNTEILRAAGAIIAAVDTGADEANGAVGHQYLSTPSVIAVGRPNSPATAHVVSAGRAGRTVRRQDRRNGTPPRVAERP